MDQSTMNLKGFFSILCHEWQTCICSPKRYRKLLISSVWVSCWYFQFGFLETLWTEGKYNLFLSPMIYFKEWSYCPTNTVAENGLLASSALLFKEEPEACHFLQKYPAPTGLISHGSK